MTGYKFDIFKRCEFTRLTEEFASLPFECGDSDLEDFFHNEAVLYAKACLGKTYCFIDNSNETTKVVAFFTVSNDSVKTRFIPKSSTNKVQRKIPGQKHLRTYPAVLIGRLGVNKEYQSSDFLIGQQVINYLKTWFIEEDNKTGCRFLVVDAYNRDRVLRFYERNKFKYLYADENQERFEQHIADDMPLNTRHMFLDLLNTPILEYPFVNHQYRVR